MYDVISLNNPKYTRVSSTPSIFSFKILLHKKLSGEQDDRVFTLAEQIIAAMPDRIKVRLGQGHLHYGRNDPDTLTTV